MLWVDDEINKDIRYYKAAAYRRCSVLQSKKTERQLFYAEQVLVSILRWRGLYSFTFKTITFTFQLASLRTKLFDCERTIN